MSEIKVAVWDDPITSSLHESWSSGSGLTINVMPLSPDMAERAILRGDVDVALLPSTHVLLRTDTFDILSESAISTWRNQNALIRLPEIVPPGKLFIQAGERDSIFDFVSAVILKEHYHYSVERQNILPGNKSEFDLDQYTVLSVEPSDTIYIYDRFLDVSQEWYELVNYPMVWGLFVCGKNCATDEYIKGIREWLAVVYSEAVDEFITEAGDMSDRIRPRLDDLAIASLTELCDFMFYYGASPDVPVLTTVEIETESC